MVSTSPLRAGTDLVGTSMVVTSMVASAGEGLGDGTGRSAGDVGCTVNSGFFSPGGPTCSRFSTGDVGDGRSVGTRSSGEVGTADGVWL